MKQYKIKGMSCNHCKAAVEKAITNTPGVTSVTVDLSEGIASVEGTTQPDDIVSSVEELGYTCVPVIN